MAVADTIALKALLALLADPSVTWIRARGRGAEVRRGGRTYQEDLSQHPGALEDLIERLVGPGRASGSVVLRSFTGFAALPPISADPVLVLRRPTPARVSPDAVIEAGLLTPEITQTAKSLLAIGAGILVAGPRGSRSSVVLSALVQLLPASTHLALVEDEPRIAPTRDALRLRDLPPDLVRSLGDVLIVLDLPRPPSLLGLPTGVLAAFRARSPEAACARACAGPMGVILGRAEQAVLLADLTPLLLWYDSAPRLNAVYELLPLPDPTGAPCRLQMLLGTDPTTGALIPTGAAPKDAQLAAVWTEAGLP
jgi:hypothetical protein